MTQHKSNRVLFIIKDTFLILLGIGSAGMGLKGFLMSSNFIDGGATGISMLLSEIFGTSLAILIPLINLPFIIMSYRYIGQTFAIRSVLAIAGLAVCLFAVPYPDVTPDPLLTAVFGGFFIGAGIGLAMRGGAVLDGTEALAVLVSRKSRFLKVGDVILLLNVFIFGAAAFFLSTESALYSMVTYFAAFKTIDFIVSGIEQYTATMIVSPKFAQIREKIQAQGWGITSLLSPQGFGKRGEQGESLEVLYVIVTRLELSRLMDVVFEIDPGAFVSQSTLENVDGGKVKSMGIH